MVAKRTSKQVFGAGEPGAPSRTPIYHQIFMLLKSKIHEGEYVEGQYLPGERELCELYDISRITAVRVLNELAACGLVVREQGRGTRVRFVAQGTLVRGPTSSPGANLRPGTVEDFLDALRLRTAREVTLHAFETTEARGTIAQMLEMREGLPVQIATRVWRFEGKPYNHLMTHVPGDIASRWAREDMERKPLSLLLEETGVRIDRINERVSAVLADLVLSERLEISFGAPLVRVSRIIHDSRGRPVEYMIGHYPPERYEYAVSLRRRNAPAG